MVLKDAGSDCLMEVIALSSASFSQVRFNSMPTSAGNLDIKAMSSAEVISEMMSSSSSNTNCFEY